MPGRVMFFGIVRTTDGKLIARAPPIGGRVTEAFSNFLEWCLYNRIVDGTHSAVVRRPFVRNTQWNGLAESILVC